MPTSLKAADLSAKLSRADAEKRLEAAQRHLLHLRLINAGLVGDGPLGPPLLIVMEGWDAAGKGGAIRRLVAPLDPRHVTVAAFAAPSEREARHHFLWRFFPVLPGWGGMTVLDRSWYGRVLVERVEGLIEPAAWQRAYGEINEIEHSLTSEGMVIVKLFLHISDDEQLRRFEDRARNPLKAWKLTEEDWRNRAKRSDYEIAINEMLVQTDTTHAPWDVVAAESKSFARVRVIETVIARLEAGMLTAGLTPPPSAGRDFRD